VRHRWLLVVLLVVLAVVVLGLVLHRPLLRAAGRALIVEDPRRPADAIVVVAGYTPPREEVAASLFREGLAPRILVSRQLVPPRVNRLLEMGIRRLDFQGESVAALEKFGVPREAIVTLDQPVEITETELPIVAAAARARGWHRLILVTSAQHTRRVKVIWSRLAHPGLEAWVVAVNDECSLSPAWWRLRRCSEAVLHEYLGLSALYLHTSRLMR